MSTPESQTQNKVRRANQSILGFKERWEMKMAAQVGKVKMVVSRSLATQHPVKLIGILALGALLLAGTGIQFVPKASNESGGRPSGGVEAPQNVTNAGTVNADIVTTVKSNNPGTGLRDEVSLWMKPWTKPPAPEVVVNKPAPERPWQEAGINVQAQQAAQRELIELGFATMEEEQFQASVAEADDAGHGELLLRAGFTEQQVRNAQERQREAHEEAEAERFFRQLVPIYAKSELWRQGFADFQGNVSVAAADDAGYRGLLLRAGFTELQIQDTQRRQRQAYEEAMADLWFQQAGEILGLKGVTP
jgi:uncharacterized protein (DUF934 family)